MGETGDEVTVNVEKNEVNPKISPEEAKKNRKSKRDGSALYVTENSKNESDKESK